MKQKAFLGSLVLQLQQNQVIGVDDISFASPKTKEAVNMLTALESVGKKTLLIVDEHNSVTYKSFRNLPGVTMTTVALVNPYELLTHKQVILTEKAIELLPTRFHLLAK